jgi:predicted ATPase
VGEVFARAHSLALELNDHSDFIEILWGLGNFNLVTLKLDAAYESASDLLALTEKTAEPSLQFQAHHLIGLVCYHRGDFYSALEHTGRIATLYDSRLHRAHATTYGFDTRVASGSYSACAYWTVGQPDRALAEIEFVLGYARELAHAHTLAYALFFGTLLHQFRREWEKARNLAEELLAVSSDKGLIHFLNASRIFIGLAEAETADREQGIDQMRRGLTAYRATGAETSRPRVRAQIAEHLGKAGRVEEALTIVTDEIESIGSARFHLSELYRVKGDLLALSASHVVGNEAELWFQRAIDLARDQKAKSFELRAVMSLCRHRRQRGSPDDARRLLNDLYGTFTEGLDTGDLKEAQAMLAEDPGPN